MAEINSTATTEQEEIGGCAKTSRIIEELWARTADSLSPKELEWFAGAGTNAAFQANNLSEVLEGIGCLAASDESNKYRAGSFSDGHSLSSLLFIISSQIDAIAGVMGISNLANHRLTNPEPYQQMKDARGKLEQEAAA